MYKCDNCSKLPVKPVIPGIGDNKLIAEFMGISRYNENKSITLCVPPSQNVHDKRQCFFGDELEYHSSWDWLMPVVGKIGKIIYSNRFIFNERNRHFSDICISATTILDVYAECIQFIKWYNKNKEEYEKLTK